MQKFSFFIKIFKKAVFFISLVILILAVVTAVSARFDIPGGFRIYSVLTGSMKPMIPVGSLIVSKIPTESRDIEKEDIITFEQPGFENKFITHRVHEVVKRGETRFFTTKGDANETFDSWLISYGRVKGIYQRHIPYLGYFLEFLRSPFGIALFVLLPVSLLAIGELKNIGSILLEMKLQKVKKVKKKKTAKKMLIVVLFAFFLLGIPQTFALFASEPVEISSISVTTGTWGNLDNVVINEVMWMGSMGKPSDEWIELRNTTSNPIDLTGWIIEGAGSGSASITLSGTIPASGYFLISHYNSSNSAINNTISVDLVVSGISLNNDGEQLTLKNSSGTIIDQTPTGAWAAGTHTSPATVEQSMERNDDPSTGWHTCEDAACNDTTYWDSEGNNYGTPKAVNLSEGDPSVPAPAPTLEPAIIPTSTPVEEAAPTATPSPEVSPTPLPKADPPLLVTLTPTAEPSLTPEPSPTAEPTPVPSTTPIPSPSPEPSPTASSEPSPSPSPQPTITPAPTSEPIPTLTATPSLVNDEKTTENDE